jgi:Flp pilus assembly protein TadD
MALGDVAQVEGRMDEAVANYNRAVTLEPGRWEAWRSLGLALLKMGKDQEAVLAARKAIELAPGYFSPHLTLGTIHFQRGRFAEAANEYRIVTELAPLQPEGFSSYGGALLAAENEAEAEKALRRSVELRETEVALNNLGVLLGYQRRDVEAVEVFSRSLKFNAKSTMLQMNLANALKRLGRAAEAQIHFRQASALTRAALVRNPGDAEARAQLAFVQVQTGDRDAGLDNALQAARLDPKNYSVLLWATITLETIGKREMAVPLLRLATPQQLRDLRKQPDLQSFVRDPNYRQHFLERKGNN